MLSARESRSRKTTSQLKSRLPAARSKRCNSSTALPDMARGGEENDEQMAEPVYRRVVVKLSGEYLAGSHGYGIDQPTIDRVAGEVIAAQKLGTEVAVVI